MMFDFLNVEKSYMCPLLNILVIRNFKIHFRAINKC